MMEGIQTNPLLWFVLLVPLSTVNSQKSIVISPSCLIQYKLPKPDGTNLNIKIDEKEKYCKTINRLRNKVSDRIEVPGNNLEMPHITPIARDGKYLANIEVEMKPNKDGKYSRIMFLEMVMYLRSKTDGVVVDKAVDKKCIRLRLKNRNTKPHWRPLTFSFACIELVEEPGQYFLLATQLWSLSDQRYSNRCRSKRSLADPGSSCGIQCSEELMYPLSLEGENEYRLCTCADKMAFNITTDIQETHARISIDGLPPLIGDMTAKIVNISEKIVYENVIKSTDIRDRRLQLITPKLPPGNYTIYIDADCQFRKTDTGYHRREKIKEKIVSLCHEDDIHAQATFDVIETPIGRVPYTEIFSVVSATIVAVFVTCIVFVAVQNRKARSRAKKSKPETQDQRIDMVDFTEHLYDRPLLSQNADKNKTLDKTECETSLDTEHVEVKKHVHFYSTESPKELENNKNELNCGKPMKSKMDQINGEKAGIMPVMVTFHPDTLEHVNSVEKLVKVLKDQKICVICSDEENWRDFAENAIDEYTHILMVLSEGLIQLCKSYKAGGIENEQFQKLISTRNQEYVPCVLMDKIRVKVHENPNRSDFYLHLVTLCDTERESKKLLRHFYVEHDFLTRCSQVEEYCLFPSNMSDMNKLITNLPS